MGLSAFQRMVLNFVVLLLLFYYCSLVELCTSKNDILTIDLDTCICSGTKVRVLAGCCRAEDQHPLWARSYTYLHGQKRRMMNNDKS